jgi:outer membrane receptor protein involved in Fe transport
VKARLCVFLLTLLAQAADTAYIHGRVLDNSTGQPLARVRVAVCGQALAVITTATGDFSLPNIRSGALDVELGAAGFALEVRHVNLPPGTRLEVEWRIGVGPGPGLRGGELRLLSGALFNDPVRAVESLPGVSVRDELYANFTYHGAAGLYLDGVELRNGYHTFQGVERFGSVSLLNADVVDAVVLQGEPSARYAGAAVLNLETRDTGREGPRFRLNANAFETTLTGQGALGRRAYWLASARRSYLQYIVGVMGAPSLALGYQDVFTRLQYNTGPRHRLTLLLLGGTTNADGTGLSVESFVDTFMDGRQRTALGQFTWSWTPTPRAAFQTVAAWNRLTERHFNGVRAPLLDTTAQSADLRHDGSLAFGRARLEAGAEAHRDAQRYTRLAAWDAASRTPGGALWPVAAFRASTWNTAAYAQQNWSPVSRLQFTTGARVDRVSLTAQNVWQPRASVAVGLSRRLRWSADYGVFARLPDLVERFGPFPNAALGAERAVRLQSGLAWRLSPADRLFVNLYGLDSRHIAWSEQAEWRLLGERTLWPRYGAPLRDTLRGRARGVEAAYERRGAGRLSGRFAYSYGRARNDDPLTGAHFDADLNQRHSVQAFSAWRLSPAVSLSARYRWSSGLPVPGYYRADLTAEYPQFWLSDQRNQFRMPAFSRLDLRADKSWYRPRSRITFYIELTNALNQRHYRFCSFEQLPFGVTSGWLARERTIPILPMAGLRMEF